MNRYTKEQDKRFSICLIPNISRSVKIKNSDIKFCSSFTDYSGYKTHHKNGEPWFQKYGLSETFCILLDIGIAQIPTKWNIYGRNSDKTSQFLWRQYVCLIRLPKTRKLHYIRSQRLVSNICMSSEMNKWETRMIPGKNPDWHLLLLPVAEAQSWCHTSWARSLQTRESCTC